MGNNLDKSKSHFESGANVNCKSQRNGREGNPTGSPSALTNGNKLNTVAKLFYKTNPLSL
jgi:hypothetical protein